MRDPERIDRILDIVRSAWEKHPDLRLTQLLMSSIDLKGQPCPLVFHCEDDKLEAGLRETFIDD